MPSRVRLIGYHPNYGHCHGGSLAYYVREQWSASYNAAVEIEQVAPLGFQGWPSWKKCLWKAKKCGGWKIFAFRENRRTRMNKSKYGAKFIEWGLGFPKYKGLKKVKIKVDDVMKKLYARVGVPPDPFIAAEQQVDRVHNIRFEVPAPGAVINVEGAQQNNPYFQVGQGLGQQQVVGQQADGQIYFQQPAWNWGRADNNVPQPLQQVVGQRVRAGRRQRPVPFVPPVEPIDINDF